MYKFDFKVEDELTDYYINLFIGLTSRIDASSRFRLLIDFKLVY